MNLEVLGEVLVLHGEASAVVPHGPEHTEHGLLNHGALHLWLQQPYGPRRALIGGISPPAAPGSAAVAQPRRPPPPWASSPLQ